MSFKTILLLSFLVFSFVRPCQATHIRAGEITGVQIDAFTYRFTLRLYTDNNPGNARSDEVEFDFGDGTSVRQVPVVERIEIDIETDFNLFVVEHTYSSEGSFRVSVTEDNRNSGILISIMATL